GSMNYYKVGAGTLTLGGETSNFGTGTPIINEGNLVLNKSAGAIALPGSSVIVGDGRGGQDADVLQFGPAGVANQVQGTAAITVQSSGKIDLATNSASATIATLNLFEGANSSADVSLSSGTLTIGGTVNAAINA